MGAYAFVEHHPWAQDIGLVLNFEARGSGGPSFMLIETNGGNENIIKAFSEAKVNNPVANSLMYEVYKALPNGTDLTAFREKGNIDGMNFAFIDDHFDYHTAQDSYERIDRDSLNHQADYLMASLNYFAFADLTQLKSERDMIYFNLPGFGMVTYPSTWVIPLLLIAGLLLIVITYSGLKRKKLSVKAMAIGFLPLMASLTIAGLIGYFGWLLMLEIFPQYLDIPQGFTYNGHWIIAAFIALTFAVTLAIYRVFNQKYDSNDLLFAPLILWLILNIVISLKLTGAGFFIIPLYLALAGFYLKVVSKSTAEVQLLLVTLLAVPSVLLLAPFAPLLVIALGLKMMGIGTVLATLSLVLLVPVFCNYPQLKRLIGGIAMLSLLFLAVSATKSDYTPERKKPNSINYVYDKDNHNAFMFSYNHSYDDFIGQFFDQNASNIPWDSSVYPEHSRRRITYHQATDKLDVVAADVRIVSDELINDQRTVSLLITPGRTTNIIQLRSKKPLKVNRLIVNEQLFTDVDGDLSKEVKGNVLNYKLTSANEQVAIKLTVPKDSELSLKVYGTSFDLLKKLPDIQPRGPLYMPHPFSLNDAIIIGQSVPLK